MSPGRQKDQKAALREEEQDATVGDHDDGLAERELNLIWQDDANTVDYLSSY